MMISPAYREQNRILHEQSAKYGTSGAQWSQYVREMVQEEGFTSILDFACGKGTLAKALPDLPIAEYDPAIPGKEATPEPAELVICTDVLEHIEPQCLDAVLTDLARVTKRKLLFDICIVPSVKKLPDGGQTHQILETPDWWKERIGRFFDVTQFVQRPEFSFCYGEAVPKGQGEAERSRKANGPKRRRKVTPDLAAFFKAIREAQEKNADAFSRVESIRLYEGVGDQMTDLHVIMDWLDEETDPESIIRGALSLSRKGLIVRAAITETRTEAWWRAIFDKYVRMIDWQAANGTLVAIGAPMVGVKGFNVVGVVDTDKRWEQVKDNSARIKKRVELAPRHKRKAIIACYGPSLRDMMQRLTDEAWEADADVISVSGAHDFLLDGGVVPDYHVECDPRPHKADNIKGGQRGVQYLLGSCVHPNLIDKLEAFDVALWHVGAPEHSRRFVEELGEDNRLVIPGGGSVGLRSIPLLYGMGYREFAVYGMDCCFADQGKTHWAGKHAGKRQPVIEIKVEGETYYTSPQLLSYATDFLEMQQKIADAEFTIYGASLLAHMCAVRAQMQPLKQTGT